MDFLFISESASFDSYHWWGLLFIKSFAILLFALGFDELLKGRIGAVTRHAILVSSFLALFCLLAGSLAIGLARFEVQIPITAAENVIQSAEGAESRLFGDAVPVAALSDEKMASAEFAQEHASSIAPLNQDNNRAIREMALVKEANPRTLSELLFVIWLVGFSGVFLFQLLIYFVANRRVRINSAPSKGEFKREVEACRELIGVRQKIRLRISSADLSPLTFGILYPAIVLPSRFNDLMAKEQRLVLLHELHHIRRNDAGTRLFAKTVCALFWCNPLAWLIYRRMVKLQEFACDEAVLDTTGEAADYADLLVSIAKHSRGATYSGLIPMAVNWQLSERVKAILNEKPFSGRTHVVARLLLLSFCALMGLFGLTLITRVEAAVEEKVEVESSQTYDESDLKHLRGIYDMYQRGGQHFPAGLHYTGSARKFQRRDSENRLDEHPVPTRFAVWLDGSWESPKFRTDLEPGVSMWTAGAAPWYIRNETQFSVGGELRSIEHRYIGQHTPEIYGGGIGMVPGIFAILSTSHLADSSEGTVEEGSRSRLFHEIESRLVQKAQVSSSVEMRIEENRTVFPGEKITQVAMDYSGSRETWWFDSKRDYALRGWVRELFPEGRLLYRRELKISKLVSIGNGRWFPVRSISSLDRFGREGEPVERQWSHDYTFDEVAVLDRIPESTFTLEGIRESVENRVPAVVSPVKTVGGTVVDESGLPVPEVRVILEVTTSEDRRKSLESTSDVNGKWKAILPEAHTGEFSLRLSHPEFVTDRYSQDFRERASQPYSALFDQTAQIVIKRGESFSGKVIDHRGSPVEGVEIVTVRDRWGANIPDIRTDSKGVFRIPPFNADFLRNSGKIYLTAQAKNHGPALRVIALEDVEGGQPVVVALTPPGKLRLRFVDRSGSPVSGARVVADRWREETRTLVFNRRTDSSGRVAWDNAPHDAISFDILGPDVTLRDCWVIPGEEEITIVLRPAFTIEGKVVSGGDGKPVENFRVTQGRKTRPTDRKPYWEESRTKSFSNGAFSLSGAHIGWLYSFRIEAEGYKPFTTEEFEAKKNDVAVQITLQKLE